MIRTAILTISDRSSRGEREDRSGPAIQSIIEEIGWTISAKSIVPDEENEIKARLNEWAQSGLVDLILTTGGTGFSPRDVTPEATMAVIERQTPGISEVMRHESMKVTPHAMLSRAVSGICKQTLIINLPGSPKAAIENLQTLLPVLPHAIELLQDNPASEAGHRKPS